MSAKDIKKIYNLIERCCSSCDSDKQFRQENQNSCKLIINALFVKIPNELFYDDKKILHCKIYDGIQAEKQSGQIMMQDYI